MPRRFSIEFLFAALFIVASAAFYGCSDDDSCQNEAAELTITVVNDSDTVIYLNERSLGPVEFFVAKDGNWEAFLPGIGCHTNCADCSNPCRDSCVQIYPEQCAPVIESYEPGAAKEFAWNGLRTQSQYAAFPTCYCDEAGAEVSCLEEWPAVKGRYKVKLCHSTSYTPQDLGCGGDYLKGELDDPTCLEVEFDYDPCVKAPVEVRIP